MFRPIPWEEWKRRLQELQACGLIKCDLGHPREFSIFQPKETYRAKTLVLAVLEDTQRGWQGAAMTYEALMLAMIQFKVPELILHDALFNLIDEGEIRIYENESSSEVCITLYSNENLPELIFRPDQEQEIAVELAAAQRRFIKILKELTLLMSPRRA